MFFFRCTYGCIYIFLLIEVITKCLANFYPSCAFLLLIMIALGSDIPNFRVVFHLTDKQFNVNMFQIFRHNICNFFLLSQRFLTRLRLCDGSVHRPFRHKVMRDRTCARGYLAARFDHAVILARKLDARRR